MCNINIDLEKVCTHLIYKLLKLFKEKAFESKIHFV